jgi:hypothetical protein
VRVPGKVRCNFEQSADDISNLSIKVLAQRQLATERKLQHLQYVGSSHHGLLRRSQRPDQASFSVSNPSSSLSRTSSPHSLIFPFTDPPSLIKKSTTEHLPPMLLPNLLYHRMINNRPQPAPQPHHRPPIVCWLSLRLRPSQQGLHHQAPHLFHH